MATYPIPTRSGTMTETESTITIRTDDGGVISVNYRDRDTIIDLKTKLASTYNHSIESLAFVFSGGVPGDPIEQVGNDRLVQDFAGRQGTLRLNIQRSAEMPTTNNSTTASGNRGRGVSDGNNSIGEVDAAQRGRAHAGDWHSEAALAAGSGGIQGPVNRIDKAKIRDDARVTSGNKYGGVDPFA